MVAAPGSELLARGHAAWPAGLLRLSARLTIRLTPSGGADRIDSRAKDAQGKPYLKARVRAPPENNEANRALEALIAKAFGVAKSKVTVVRGQTARLKIVEIDGATVAEIAALIARFGEA